MLIVLMNLSIFYLITPFTDLCFEIYFTFIFIIVNEYEVDRNEWKNGSTFIM